MHSYQHDDHAQTKPLNEMPLDFAKEIVRLWRVFVKDLEMIIHKFTVSLTLQHRRRWHPEINAAKRVRTNDVTQRQIFVEKRTSGLEPGIFEFRRLNACLD